MATTKSGLNYEGVIPIIRDSRTLIVCTSILQVEPCVVDLMGSPFKPFYHAPAYSDRFSVGKAGA